MKNLDRKSFLKKSAAVGIGGTLAMGFPTVLMGKPNETINFAVVGVRSRGKAHDHFSELLEK